MGKLAEKSRICVGVNESILGGCGVEKLYGLNERTSGKIHDA